MALATGTRRIAFAGPAKTDAELAAALAHGVTVNVESALELRRLAALAGSAAGPGSRCGSTGPVPACRAVTG